MVLFTTIPMTSKYNAKPGFYKGDYYKSQLEITVAEEIEYLMMAEPEDRWEIWKNVSSCVYEDKIIVIPKRNGNGNYNWKVDWVAYGFDAKVLFYIEAKGYVRPDDLPKFNGYARLRKKDPTLPPLYLVRKSITRMILLEDFLEERKYES